MKEKEIQCSICGKMILEKDSHNACPVNNGRCCLECNKIVCNRRVNDFKNKTTPEVIVYQINIDDLEEETDEIDLTHIYNLLDEIRAHSDEINTRLRDINQNCNTIQKTLEDIEKE